MDKFLKFAVYFFAFFSGLVKEISGNNVPVQSVRPYNICGQNGGRRIYLEQGRNALISARNVQILPLLNHVKPDHFNRLAGNADEDERAPQECRIEVVACPGCVIQWKVTKINITDCSNDHVELTEPGYADLSRHQICSENVAGKSLSRVLLIRLVFTKNYDFAFEMQIEIQRNQITVFGQPIENRSIYETNEEVIISTPFFPMPYQRDYEVEYKIQCPGRCSVHVNFIDFQVAPSSVLEIIDLEGERFEIFTGLSLRPRIFLSKGSSIVVRFNANGGIEMGFNMKINFLGEKQLSNPLWTPKTDCGGYVERLGGAITMMRMANNESDSQFYDCIWIIRPSNKFFHIKTQESLQIATLVLLDNSTLNVHRGPTSKGDLIGAFTNSDNINNAELVSSVEDGFYIHLRGNFSLESKMELVFTAFSLANCNSGSDFRCTNQKCVPISVRCDGFDHCGDESDEPETCLLEWETNSSDRQWYKYIPNYYFPATEYDLKAASILFISTSAGLVALIACLFMVLYRINVRTRHHRELQNHLQTISELLDQNNRNNEHDDEPPPLYEAPPEYEEVIKVGMDKEIRRSARRGKEEHRRRKSRQPILEPETEENSPEIPSTSNDPAIPPFAIETPATLEETQETEGPPIEATHPSKEEDLSEEISDHEIPITSNGNGYLIVFQNDEPTAVPVHECIPVEVKLSMINSCLRCENNNQRETKLQNRITRRCSADPLLSRCSPSPEIIEQSN